MKCSRCEKIIRTCFKLGVDVFCSKKCFWIRVVEEAIDSSGEITKEEAYKDISCLEAQQILFNEDLDYEAKPASETSEIRNVVTKEARKE